MYIQCKKTMTVPILVLTGFLGAGKTTLLKRCLLNKLNIRIAVIRNEFSAEEEELSFECPILIKEEDEQDFASFWELPNSCVCCTFKSKFLQGLTKMMKKAQDARRPFDLIIVEISGVADPVAFSSTLVSELDSPEDFIRLGGIVAVMDCSSFDKHLNFEPQEREAVLYSLHHEAQPKTSSGKRPSAQMERQQDYRGQEFRLLLLKQICAADLIILNKCDLVQAKNHVEELKCLARQLSPQAVILE
eukprot:Gregarina_sp_Poly_1__1227@NODE_12_length_23383_cov_104_521445_g10_i0_p7_GENE_NODE_12_length_23383_cov_104_521445_g10_i0NODE_12_length_23383_cov_104_521445_g10_i0_p7_ORF_typecomplete_len246_score41_75cobW/PF02492_19/1_1e40MeaB/PF03308_16/0_44MeaB/PF03308_16/33MeaB/PF03308_16/1_6Rad17/PF03215_15/0_00011AAA_22/PF13401_6/0_041AAA_22/PF13401_6/8_7TsaE/PF02367_17/0_007RsgA_GTPase/PF03193_16/11RsgA_GTPase/PF03193_16/1_7dNK/PF01712_19/0_012TniB/PF05621_11/0_088TniB/PF05621_11/6e02SRPRB/PF09439_10/0_23Ar